MWNDDSWVFPDNDTDFQQVLISNRSLNVKKNLPKTLKDYIVKFDEEKWTLS